jgi:hypothetical protein
VQEDITVEIDIPRSNEDILVIDTGGGMNATITKHA